MSVRLASPRASSSSPPPSSRLHVSQQTSPPEGEDHPRPLRNANRSVGQFPLHDVTVARIPSSPSVVALVPRAQPGRRRDQQQHARLRPRPPTGLMDVVVVVAVPDLGSPDIRPARLAVLSRSSTPPRWGTLSGARWLGCVLKLARRCTRKVLTFTGGWLQGLVIASRPPPPPPQQEAHEGQQQQPWHLRSNTYTVRSRRPRPHASQPSPVRSVYHLRCACVRSAPPSPMEYSEFRIPGPAADRARLT